MEDSDEENVNDKLDKPVFGHSKKALEFGMG